MTRLCPICGTCATCGEAIEQEPDSSWSHNVSNDDKDHEANPKADTCSRPILDSFGGGAAFITATDERWMASSTWIVDQINAHKPTTEVQP